MRRPLVLVALLIAALAVPSLAAAKGPSSASISGPGLDRTLAVSGDGEGLGTPLGTLADASGFFAQMFGQTPDPILTARPRVALGPRYKIAYIVPGPNGERSRVVQLVYPFAKSGPLTYLRPGQRFWTTETSRGGWYRSPAALKTMLVRAGVPTSSH